MKKLSHVILATMMLFATFLYSCDKEIETSPLTLDNSQKGTIKGYVYANTDLTKFGNELAPAGTQVIITMPYNSITGLEDSKGQLIDTVLVGTDGTFEYKVPTCAKGVNVKVSLSFVFDQVQLLGSQHATIKKTFIYSDNVFSAVKPNELQIKTITAKEDVTLGDDSEWYTITGTIYCDYDESTAGNEKLPAGTQIIFNTPAGSKDSWSTTVTVGTDGKYSVNVPSGKDIYINYNFTLSGKLSGGTAVTFRFRATEKLGTFSANTKDVDKTLIRVGAE